MNVLLVLKSIYRELPEAERKVADYLLHESGKAPYESVSRIAQAVGVSVPSVTRLTRKLGFANFKDFKVGLAVDTAQVSKVGEIFSQIAKGDPDEAIIEKVFLGHMKALEDTLKITNRQQLGDLGKKIADAGRIIFIGQGGSGIVANEAALRFAHLDIQAESCQDGLQILLQASRLKQGQLCVGISHSGRTVLVEKGLRVAKEKGATTALITNYMNTPMKAHCDYVVFTSFVENSVKAAALSSNLIQMAIIDTLYLLAAKKKKAIWDFAGIDSLFDRLLRS